jgi:threonine/homoserine/homoserine lactone efflux protein
MSVSTWILFVAAALAAILPPGPAVLLAVSNSVAFGWKRVTFSSLGNILGLMVLSSLALAGLGAMLKASGTAFTAFKLVGAGYLIYLGGRQWRTRGSAFTLTESAPLDHGNGRILVQGLLVALTNPKAILFFGALFPQFIRPGQALAPQVLILMGTFTSLSFLTLMSYGVLAHTVRAWFSDPRHSVWFNRVSGSVFLLLGISMARLKAGLG